MAYRRVVCAGVVLALGCMLGPVTAPALPLTEYQAKSGDTLDLYVAGSSAQDETLERLFRVICEPNSLDIFRADGGNSRLLFCRTHGGAAALPGLPAGQKVALFKSSAGGSGSGVGPLIQRTPLPFLNPADLREHFDVRCPKAGRVAHDAEGSLAAYTEYACDNTVPAKVVPDVGISDIEPRFFVSLYHLTPKDAEVLTARSANAVIFGIPVTLGLRNALQAAEFARTNPCHPSHPRYTEPVDIGGASVPRSETEPCMPGFTRAQLAGMFAGTLKTWDQVLSVQAYPLAQQKAPGAPIEAAPGVVPPADVQIHVCRRVDTSGTETAYEMFFLNAHCASGVRSMVPAGPTVFLGPGTSDVKYCLNELDRRKVWAIGIMSTENVEKLGEDRWRFVKMGGYAPTLFNSYSGRWSLFVEQSYQWRGEHAQQPLSGQKLSLIAQLGARLGNPAVIRSLDRGFRHPWGYGGVMGLSSTGAGPPLPTPGKPLDEAAVIANPVLAVSRDQNSCGRTLAVFPTPLP